MWMGLKNWIWRIGKIRVFCVRNFVFSFWEETRNVKCLFWIRIVQAQHRVWKERGERTTTPAILLQWLKYPWYSDVCRLWDCACAVVLHCSSIFGFFFNELYFYLCLFLKNIIVYEKLLPINQKYIIILKK